MADEPANPTDSAICRVLAAGPLPTTVLAARLGAPERTVRHRLYRLRLAGSVVTDVDGRHRLAVPALPARTWPSPVGIEPVPADEPDSPDHDRWEPGEHRYRDAGLILAGAGIGLAVAAGLGMALVSRRPPPLTPAPSPWDANGVRRWEPGLPW